MHGLSLAGIDINRKMLAEMGVRDPEGFAGIAEKAKAALDAQGSAAAPPASESAPEPAAEEAASE